MGSIDVKELNKKRNRIILLLAGFKKMQSQNPGTEYLEPTLEEGLKLYWDDAGFHYTVSAILQEILNSSDELL